MASIGLFQPVEKCCPCPYDGARYFDEFSSDLDPGWNNENLLIDAGRLTTTESITPNIYPSRLACAPQSFGLSVAVSAKCWQYNYRILGVGVTIASGPIWFYHNGAYYRYTAPWRAGLGDPYLPGSPPAGNEMKIVLSDASDGAGRFDCGFYVDGVLIAEELDTPLTIASNDGTFSHGVFGNRADGVLVGPIAYWDDYLYESSYV